MACLDLGCGAGDVTRELATVCGRAGHATGLELDAAKLELGRREHADVPNLTLRHGDARSLDEREGYDAVYMRFLLCYLADREAVLARVFRALRPGGVAVVEDIDFSGHFSEPRSPAFERYVRWFGEAVARRGGDADVGSRLPALLSRVGFTGVDVAVAQPVFRAGAGKEIAAITLEGIREPVTAEGIATAEEVDETLGELTHFAKREDTLLSLPRIVQTWGRRPSA
jgi:SAM-dependent methyltransferase